MRRYLNVGERAQYEQLSAFEQRRWLLGRIAVKDAVRRWLWDRGAGPVYPAEVTVGGTDGGLRVRGPFRAPAVSLAYSGPGGPGRLWAVAAAGDEPLIFTIDVDDNGSLLLTEPGRSPQLVSAADPVHLRPSPL